MPVGGQKRASDALVAVEPKRQKPGELAAYTIRDKQLLEAGVPRTSSLLAPIMVLDGHQGEIFSAEFHPDGKHLVSTGFDRQIYIWQAFGECETVGVLNGHTNAVMEVHFSPDGSHLFTASVDKHCAVWDVPTCTRIRKLRGHTNFVNSCCGVRRGPELLVSGSDDNTIRFWDARKKFAISSLDNGYQVTAVCFNDTSDQIISGGIDNTIKIWEPRKNEVLMELKGHTDTITGLALSPDGSHVLSNSMDNTLRIWDIRPYAPQERCLKIFTGHQHNFERNLLRCAWSPDSNKVSCGSSDRFVYIFDVPSRRILYKLPGHNGSVNDVAFNPNEPIILSGSSDKTLYLGEIDA